MERVLLLLVDSGAICRYEQTDQALDMLDPVLSLRTIGIKTEEGCTE